MHATPSSFLRRCAALLLCAPLAAVANPTGGTIAAGAATITHTGATTTITQGTDRAVINWSDFNVGAGELTRFVQPGAQSAVLNRVTGGNPTQIFGRLEGNGRVFVLNPNGVLVGAGGVVQTQGFIASTLNVADGDFMAGGGLRFNGASTAAVENLGRIDAGQGDAVLIAHHVRNAGEIASTGGTAALAAGSDVLLATEGDTRIWVKSGVAGSGGTGVEHSGTISAVQAELKAAGGNVYSLAVNSNGLVSATGVAERGGRIFLISDGGNVEVSGALQARKADGQGGEIYVGGGYRGKDATLGNAANTTVTDTARLNAGDDASTGGKIVVWADGHTSYAGALQTGRGGEAEVSGKGTLDFTGTVNTRGGRLLLDPTDITIDSSNFAALIGNPLLTGAVTLSASNDIIYNTSNPIQSNFTLEWDAGRDVTFAPTSAFGSTGAGNNVDFQIYAGRDVNFGLIAGLFFSAGGKALIRAGRDINMAASSTISFGSAGWILLDADTDNSTPPAHGVGKIVFDSTSNLNAAKVQIFAVAPSQFINGGSYVPPVPTYNKWEQDISLGSAGSGLWYKSNSSGTFGPTTSSLLVTANDFSRTYGSGNPTFTASYTGLTNGDTSSVVTGLQFATTATLGSNVGTYSITPFGASAPAYYNLSYAPGTLTINRAALTLSVNPAIRFYGDPNPPFSVSYNGLKNGDVGSSAVTGLQFNTPANLLTPVGAYPISLSGGTAQNYSLSLQPGTLTVTPAPLTVTIGNVSRVYGDPNTFNGTASTAGFKNGENGTGNVDGNLIRTTTATITSGVGTYPFNGSGLFSTSPNYTLSFVSGIVTITPAPLTIRANDATRQQGMDNVFSSTFTGLKNSDTPAVVSNLRYSTAVTPSSGTGTYAVTPYGAQAANYAISYQPGSLTVTQPVTVISTNVLTTSTSGGTGTWTDANLLQTVNQAQWDGLILMQSLIDQKLKLLNASKATVMAESVQYLLVEKDAVDRNRTAVDASTRAIGRLLSYLQQNYGIGPDTTNYADFVHSLMPTWLSVLKDLAATDPELRGWLTDIRGAAITGAGFIGTDNVDGVFDGLLRTAAARVAYTYRSADDKAIGAAATTYVTTRQSQLNTEMAKLQAEIKGQLVAEDPTIPHARLETLFTFDLKDLANIGPGGGVIFDTSTTVVQKWARYYALKTEADGYKQIVSGKPVTVASQPDPMVFVLQNLLDQGKIQIY
jgi:filamentous hemagglutinin family protein